MFVYKIKFIDLNAYNFSFIIFVIEPTFMSHTVCAYIWFSVKPVSYMHQKRSENIPVRKFYILVSVLIPKVSFTLLYK